MKRRDRCEIQQSMDEETRNKATQVQKDQSIESLLHKMCNQYDV